MFLVAIIIIGVLFIAFGFYAASLPEADMPLEGDSYFFGNYMQDSKTSGEKQPIEWQCLKKDTINDRWLLISKKCLDYKPYAIDVEKATWETSYIRKWLNDEFLNTAFNEQEQKRILSTTLTTKANITHHTKGGNDTVDKVFLLSEEELDLYLGFTGEYKSTYTMERNRRASATEYARTSKFPDENGEDYDYEYDKEKYYKVSWWIRTPGDSLKKASNIGFTGSLSLNRNGVPISNYCHVRPAIWVTYEEKKKEENEN